MNLAFIGYHYYPKNAMPLDNQTMQKPVKNRY